MSNWKDTPGKTQDVMVRLSLSSKEVSHDPTPEPGMDGFNITHTSELTRSLSGQTLLTWLLLELSDTNVWLFTLNFWVTLLQLHQQTLTSLELRPKTCRALT